MSVCSGISGTGVSAVTTAAEANPVDTDPSGATRTAQIVRAALPQTNYGGTLMTASLYTAPIGRAAAAFGAIAVAAWGIVGCGHKGAEKPMTDREYGQSVQDSAGKACDRTSNVTPPSMQGTVSGGSIELHGHAGDPLWVTRWYLDLNYATSDATFKSLACVDQQRVKVGTYVDQATNKTSDADRLDWTVRILSWPSGDVVAVHQFQGADPPDSCTSGNGLNECEGKPPQDQATAWVKTVITS